MNCKQPPASSLPGGNTGTLIVALNESTDSAEAVTLHSTDAKIVPVPASVTIPAGTQKVSLPITTGSVTSSLTATVTGTPAGKSLSSRVVVTPPAISSLTILPNIVYATQPAVGKVTIDTPATGSGAVVTLRTSSSVLTIPASVTVPPGATHATFLIATNTVSAQAMATVTGKLGNRLASRLLTVDPY